MKAVHCTGIILFRISSVICPPSFIHAGQCRVHLLQAGKFCAWRGIERDPCIFPENSDPGTVGETKGIMIIYLHLLHRLHINFPFMNIWRIFSYFPRILNIDENFIHFHVVLIYAKFEECGDHVQSHRLYKGLKFSLKFNNLLITSSPWLWQLACDAKITRISAKMWQPGGDIFTTKHCTTCISYIA